MTVLEIIRGITSEKRAKKKIPDYALYLEVLEKSELSRKELNAELNRLYAQGIISSGPTMKGRYIKLRQPMKTSVIMTRKMGKFDVLQRTSDGMFNATSLLRQWNEYSGQKKQMAHYTENNATSEFIQALTEDINQQPDNNGIIKQRNSVLIQSRGKNGGTWMHPLLFIDFAMWLNPKFKLKVLQFVYDELIKHRHIAGDNYKKLSSTIASLGVDYKQIGRGLNYIVFGKHESGIRNTATQEQLNELHELENKLSFAVSMGFIRTNDQLLITMRKMWNDKHCRI